MNIIKEKLKKLPKLNPIPVDASELEQGYTVYLKPMNGGELSYWRERTIDPSGDLYNSSTTEKLLLGITICLVDKDGDSLLDIKEFQTLAEVPLQLLDRLIQAFFKLNNLSSEVNSPSDGDDLKNLSEATPAD